MTLRSFLAAGALALAMPAAALAASGAPRCLLTHNAFTTHRIEVKCVSAPPGCDPAVMSDAAMRAACAKAAKAAGRSGT